MIYEPALNLKVAALSTVPTLWKTFKRRVVGQERAIDAIKFGMGMKERGYNIFIAGPSNAGLTYTAKTFIEEQAKQEPTPPDWCYVYNFKEPDKPKGVKVTRRAGQSSSKKICTNSLRPSRRRFPKSSTATIIALKRVKCTSLSRK